MIKYDEFRFSLERFHHDNLYVISASYVLLGDLVKARPDNELVTIKPGDTYREETIKALEKLGYNLTPTKNIALSDIIGVKRLKKLNARLVNEKMELDLSEINDILAVVNRKFVVTENKFSYYSAYNLEANSPFGYHPIERFSEQPEWLLPHLNSNRIQSFNTKRSL